MKKGIFLVGLVVSFAAELAAQPARIQGPVNPNRIQMLTGHVNPQARPEWDRGLVDPAMRLNWVRLIIKPSDAQQADLNQFLREVQNPRSPLFHKWLAPEQFADRFGASRADVAKIAAWMQSQGFDVIRIGRGRRFIAFNATARQIQNALKTEIHHYQVEDELHFANSSEPSVPEAIQPLVMGFQGLTDFGPKAAYRSRMKPSVNGPHNPAAAGTYIQIYGTGEGQTNPPGVDGQIADESAQFIPRPTASVSVTIGGVKANVTYAGTAPQSFAGFFQVNAQIPAGTKSGNQPVVLIIGGVKSPPLNVSVK